MCDLTEGFDLAVSTLSHHLKILHDAGLVERDKRGVWVYYKARPEAMNALRTLFSTGLSDSEPGIPAESRAPAPLTVGAV